MRSGKKIFGGKCMRIGTVTETVEPVRAANCLTGQTLFTVCTAEGDLAAVDCCGAAVGDRVLLLTGPAAERLCMETPLDAAIVAVLGCGCEGGKKD